MKNKDFIEIILGLIIVIVFSFIFYNIGYLQGQKESTKWVEDKINKINKIK